jgi:hypothetical protein
MLSQLFSGADIAGCPGHDQERSGKVDGGIKQGRADGRSGVVGVIGAGNQPDSWPQSGRNVVGEAGDEPVQLGIWEVGL